MEEEIRIGPDWKESAIKEWEYWEYLVVPGRAATKVVHNVRNRSDMFDVDWPKIESVAHQT